jgi:hypothetical protein
MEYCRRGQNTLATSKTATTESIEGHAKRFNNKNIKSPEFLFLFFSRWPLQLFRPPYTNHYRQRQQPLNRSTNITEHQNTTNFFFIIYLFICFSHRKSVLVTMKQEKKIALESSLKVLPIWALCPHGRCCHQKNPQQNNTNRVEKTLLQKIQTLRL